MAKKKRAKWPNVNQAESYSPVIHKKELVDAFKMSLSKDDIKLEDIPEVLKKDFLHFSDHINVKPSKLIPIKIYKKWINKLKRTGLSYEIRISNFRIN